jgi:hypothetical protein
MAILKAKYGKIDEVPEQYRDLYDEATDGSASLKRDAVEGVKTQADVDRVQAALKKERDARAALEAKVKGVDFGERTAEEVQEILDSVDDLRARADAGGKLDDETKSKVARIREIEASSKKAQREYEKVKAEAAAAGQRAAELEATIRRSTLQSEVTKAATSLKMRPEAHEDAAVIAERIFQFGEDGKPLTADGLDPAAWLSGMKEKRPHWWPESTGGGAGGNSGGAGGSAANPFGKDGATNVSRAAVIMTKDPARADSLARAAGHASAKAAIEAAASAAARAS